MVGYGFNRRFVLAALIGAASSGLSRTAAAQLAAQSGAAATPFSFDLLQAEARREAAMPFVPPPVVSPDVLDRLTYDEHWKIVFRPDAAPVVNGMPVQFFHMGKYARDPVRMHLIDGAMAQEIVYSEDFFTMPATSPAHDLGAGAGFAGLRFQRPGGEPDWIAFLGASYFRCDGPERQYGLSTRGLAIDTGTMKTEEFPRFKAFWIGPPEQADEDAVVYAQLDSPSVTGAYRIGIRQTPEGPQRTAVAARIYFRTGVERLGVAPLTSMFWYSELNRTQGADWRPEIHDSDGLAILTGSGERIWRPLRNPDRVTVSSFIDQSTRGFGLAQRDREFTSYEDDGVFYNRRSSTWVTPTSDWGPGAVQLLEIPTADETFDNIVAYWTPATQPAAGDALSYDYTLDWVERDPAPGDVARTVGSWRGVGGVPGQPRPEGQHKYVIDFSGGRLSSVAGDVEISVTASSGTVTGASVRPVVGQPRWRGIFDLAADPKQAVDLRVYLHVGGEPVTETWTLLAEG